MKNSLILFVSLMLFTSVNGQEITGDWNGILNVNGMQLRLVIHISNSDDGLSSTMDSPDQGANGIPITSTTLKQEL